MKVPISGRVKTSSMRVDGEADVGRVLLAGAEGRREDQVDRRLGERDDVLRIAAPVGVGALDGDLALDDVAVEEGPELLGQVRADAQRDVVEVDQQGGVRGVHWRLAQVPCGPNQRSVHVLARFRVPRAARGPLDAPGRTRTAAGQSRSTRGREPTGVVCSAGHGAERSDRRLRAESAGSPWRGSRNGPEVASAEEFRRGGGPLVVGEAAQPNWASPARGRSSTK